MKNPLNSIGGVVTCSKADELEQQGFEVGNKINSRFCRVEYVAEDIPIDLRAKLTPLPESRDTGQSHG